MSNLTLDGSQPKFDRSDTKAVKGVAVVLMLFHHLVGFPERFPVGFAGFRSIWQVLVDSGYLEQLAYAAKFCVAIFFFLGGYGLYIRLSKGTFSVKKAIFDLYLSQGRADRSCRAVGHVYGHSVARYGMSLVRASACLSCRRAFAWSASWRLLRRHVYDSAPLHKI